MNKYQEAFTEIHHILEHNHLHGMGTLEQKHFDAIKELVDKETPMKPIHREFINKFDCEDYEYLCGKCKDHLAYHRGRVDRCNDNDCNQLVDWGG